MINMILTAAYNVYTVCIALLYILHFNFTHKTVHHFSVQFIYTRLILLFLQNDGMFCYFIKCGFNNYHYTFVLFCREKGIA